MNLEERAFYARSIGTVIQENVNILNIAQLKSDIMYLAHVVASLALS